MKNKVSIYDVAKYVGVSPASVSYVVNGINKVSAKTRQKILKGIQELGFVRDNGARYLSTGKSNYICVILPTSGSLAFAQNPFYAEFIAGLEEGLSLAGYDLVISSVKESQDNFTWFHSRTFDAAVLIGIYPHDVYENLKEIGKPVVLLDVYESYADEFHNIRIKDVEGSYLSTKYLIDQGHKNIAFVSDNRKISMLDEKRFDGYKKAMEEAGIPIDAENIYTTPATFDGGFDIASLLEKNRKITAVVSVADIMAIGIMRKFILDGYKIPDDLSIVGFDDITTAGYVFPGLTTIHQDIKERGKLAADLILSDLKNNRVAPRTIEITPYLVERQSVKKIN